VSERTLVNLIYRSTAFHALTTTSTLIRTPLLLAINKFGAALAREINSERAHRKGNADRRL